jgi:Prokaryotic E2 family E
MRRDFRLPEQDEQFLEGLGLVSETISEPSNRWLVLRAYPIPTGYNHLRVDVAVNVSPGYPDAQLDMVYFHPHLARLDGKALIQVGGGYSIDGRDWQRWSRHRTPANPWRPGVDDLATHMGLVDEWLVRGLK